MAEPTEMKAPVTEEPSTRSKESWLRNEDEEPEGRGSCRLSLETSGLPTVTFCLSCISSFIWE